MPASFPDTVLDLEALDIAITKNADLVPGVLKFREPLQGVLAKIRTLSATQKTLTADKQKVTQDLKAAVAEAKNLAIDIRAIIRGEVGSRSEKLVEFGVAPLRKRKAKPGEGTEAAKRSRSASEPPKSA